VAACLVKREAGAYQIRNRRSSRRFSLHLYRGSAAELMRCVCRVLPEGQAILVAVGQELGSTRPRIRASVRAMWCSSSASSTT